MTAPFSQAKVPLTRQCPILVCYSAVFAYRRPRTLVCEQGKLARPSNAQKGYCTYCSCTSQRQRSLGRCEGTSSDISLSALLEISQPYGVHVDLVLLYGTSLGIPILSAHYDIPS